MVHCIYDIIIHCLDMFWHVLIPFCFFVFSPLVRRPDGHVAPSQVLSRQEGVCGRVPGKYPSLLKRRFYYFSGYGGVQPTDIEHFELLRPDDQAMLRAKLQVGMQVWIPVFPAHLSDFRLSLPKQAVGGGAAAGGAGSGPCPKLLMDLAKSNRSCVWQIGFLFVKECSRQSIRLASTPIL